MKTLRLRHVPPLRFGIVLGLINGFVGLLVAPVDAADTLGALLFPTRALKSVGGIIVVLDAGHGGADPGTQGVGCTEEKTLTLDIAKRVRQKLKAW